MCPQVNQRSARSALCFTTLRKPKMSPDRRRKISELCEAALKCAFEDRASFLDRACEGDGELRREVEKMLRFDEQATEFIES